MPGRFTTVFHAGAYRGIADCTAAWTTSARRVRASPLRDDQPRVATRIGAAENLGRFNSPQQRLICPGPTTKDSELVRLGINHATISGAQARLYSAFARGGGDLTWGAMQYIETQAMIAGGVEAGAAQFVVARAIAALQEAGVAGPTRIPWGG
jgi:hypothetical protein